MMGYTYYGHTYQGTNIIAGVAVGLESTCGAAVAIGASILAAYHIGSSALPGGGLFGTSVATMGMLSSAVYVLAMDTFGPIADNAGGIVEMSDQPEMVYISWHIYRETSPIW